MSEQALWETAKRFDAMPASQRPSVGYTLLPRKVQDAIERVCGNTGSDPINPRSQLTSIGSGICKTEDEAGAPLYIVPIVGGDRGVRHGQMLVGAVAISEAGDVVQQYADQRRTLGLFGPALGILLGKGDSFDSNGGGQSGQLVPAS